MRALWNGARILSCAALAACAAQPPATPERPAASKPDYERDVPAPLRTLVSAEAYAETSARLVALIADQRALPPLAPATLQRIAASPCAGALSYLVEQYYLNPEVPPALDAMANGLVPLPPGYDSRDPGRRLENPWRAANGWELFNELLDGFAEWCVFLPEIDGDQDNGLAYLQNFAWAYYRNQAGQDFVQGRNPRDPDSPLDAGRVFTQRFSAERGAFLDSGASTVRIAEWLNDPRIEIEDYQKQRVDEYRSWNEFFSRELTVDSENRTIPSRPTTMPLSRYPERDYIVVAPTDCIVNPLVQVLVMDDEVERRFVENPLQFDTVLDVKGIPISLSRLLRGVPWELAQHFEGGTGLSCVLMPNTYHRFHAPVNGTVRHAGLVEGGTYGYIDWPNWVPLDGNVGRPGTDFSQFEVFQRAVVVIEVEYRDARGVMQRGYVASIPVGLDTIGSVYLHEGITAGVEVERGYTELGGFLYGGSLDILLFSKGLASAAVQTRMGNQIGILNVGTAPPTPVDPGAK